MRKLIFLLLSTFAVLSTAQAYETAVIIKVTGVYGIIDKGANQGITEGQILFVKRASADGIADVAKVKVIRTTANRAAVEQLTRSSEPLLRKGDKLFATQRLNQRIRDSFLSTEATPREAPVETPTFRTPDRTPRQVEQRSEPVTANSDISSRTRYSNLYYFTKPWIGLNLGASFPNGALATSFAPSVKLGGNYMISTPYGFNLGVEINKTFLSSGATESQLDGGTISSASVLEAFVVLQKFLNYNFFVETGGGIYRPKMGIVSTDDVESTFSSSSFGIFGGLGVYVPTSPYAGIALKGRLHNYFDDTAKQYFGLTGGFRFKVR